MFLNVINLCGVLYDYDSVMYYYFIVFGNGWIIIICKDGSIKLGNMCGLSFKDIE